MKTSRVATSLRGRAKKIGKVFTRLTALACAASLVACTGQLPASVPTPSAASTNPGSSPTTGPAPSSSRTATPDFDGDGAVDLATSAMSGVLEDTRITVRYGSGTTAEITAQQTLLHGGDVGRHEMLAADLNADGFSDLVFVGGGPESDTSLCELFGSVDGLSLTSLHCVDVPDVRDGELTSDLELLLEPVRRVVVGISTWSGNDAVQPGRVVTYPLPTDGRIGAAPTVLTPGRGAVPDLADAGSFGASLAVAGDRLFVGAPNATVGRVAAGAVVVLAFNIEGVASGEVITQATTGVPGQPAEGDSFGASLAARDGHLAVGVPGDRVGAIRGVGAVQVFTLSQDQFGPGELLTQATEGIPGKAESDDRFGWAVAVGTVCPGVTGVVVGAPGEAVVDDHEGDGSAWIIPLERSAGCTAQQLWEGHGLGGQPQYWRRLGEKVAVIRDGAEDTDQIVVAGEGLVSDQSPIGVLTVWSTKGGQGLLHVAECIRAIAGR